MVKRRRQSDRQKQKKKKEEEKQQKEQLKEEDYCFVCKDGGFLVVCDHKSCVKAYHPDCVGKESKEGKEEATEVTDTPWICDWHSCLVCKRSSRYQCFCCPNAVCQSCFKDASFAKTRGSKGFCNDCLNLALLGEEGVEVDSDGEKVDFKDRETYEGLFKEYWDIIKEKEGLTLDDLHNADVQIKKGENAKVQRQKPQSDSDESVKQEENRESSSDDHDDNHISDHDSEDAVQPIIVTSNKRPKKAPKRKKGSSRIEYVGWASKSLIEFLAAIGVDTSKKLSQSEVTSLIITYVQETKLFHPEKRKMVVCDVRLQSLLKRKTISMYKISDAIEAHFLDNLDQSEDEGYSSGCEDNTASLPTKKQAWWRKVGSFNSKGSLLEKFQQKEGVLEEPKKLETVVKVVYSEFATIVPQNMKLVYLKRSLVENLLEKYETFESKVMGSFVKVKLEPVDPKYPYQLLPVTGISKASDNENKRALLQVSSLPSGVPMSMLSNDDLSEEDCMELLQKIGSGLISKPTVVELEKKAKDLHEDITKHVIARELSTLKHRIDLANEKGRRAELFEYRRRRDLLQSEEEQQRLLNELPKVMAEVLEVKPDSAEAGKTNDAGISPANNPSEKLEDSEKVPA